MHPFAGSTRADVLVSVLDHEPTSLTDLAPHVPAELQRIVRKALRKDPEQRYQGMKDLLLDSSRLSVTRSRRSVSRRDPAEEPLPSATRRVLDSWSPGRRSSAAAAWIRARWKRTPIAPAQRLSIELGMPGRLPGTDAPFATSRRMAPCLAFVARTNGEATQLFVRRLDQLYGHAPQRDGGRKHSVFFSRRMDSGWHSLPT